MIKWIFLGFIAVVSFLFLYIASYVGAFRDVTWEEGVRGPYHLVYQQNRGPYQKISATIVDAEKAFEALGHTCELTFGRFLDNPNVTDSDRLRSESGCLFASEPPAVPEGYEYMVLDEAEYLVANFNGAPSVGPLKVYPEARKRLSERGLSEELTPLEIYKLTPGEGVHTTYLFSLAPAE